MADEITNPYAVQKVREFRQLCLSLRSIKIRGEDFMRTWSGGLESLITSGKIDGNRESEGIRPVTADQAKIAVGCLEQVISAIDADTIAIMCSIPVEVIVRGD